MFEGSDLRAGIPKLASVGHMETWVLTKVYCWYSSGLDFMIVEVVPWYFNSLSDGTLEVQVPQSTSLAPELVKYAAMCGLSAAAVKAKLFADQEEREIQRLAATIINHQVLLVFVASFMIYGTFEMDNW